MTDQHDEVIYAEKAPFWSAKLAIATKPGLPLTLSLGDLQAGTALLPCLTGMGITGYQIRLHGRGLSPCSLAPVGVYGAETLQEDSCQWASSHVDWFELHEDVTEAELEIRLAETACPQSALLHCSKRRLQNATFAGAKAPMQVPPLAVPQLSQMTLPKTIRQQICAPISVAMVLQYYGIELALESFIQNMRHASGLYGVWPQNMLVASQYGLLATVRYFKNLEEVAYLLQLGIPVPVSLRYSKGALADAHLPETAGHLMVITGIEGQTISVNDPAAKSPDAVARQYDLDAFCQAWQGHHGIGYIIHPVNWSARER